MFCFLLENAILIDDFIFDGSVNLLLANTFRGIEAWKKAMVSQKPDNFQKLGPEVENRKGERERFHLPSNKGMTQQIKHDTQNKF